MTELLASMTAGPTRADILIMVVGAVVGIWLILKILFGRKKK